MTGMLAENMSSRRRFSGTWIIANGGRLLLAESISVTTRICKYIHSVKIVIG